jgi:dTDP-4-amino-4,6-dideoxy-D-galactose acyltransferase
MERQVKRDLRTDVTILPWDSELLGALVARASVHGLSTAETVEQLRAVHDVGARLTYLIGEPRNQLARKTLDDARARLVDERLTYVRKVDVSLADETMSCISLHDGRWPDDDLYHLAIASGEFSRFRLDPNMPRHVFLRLYSTWMARSVSGEIADVVFVARSQSSRHKMGTSRLNGMVTVKVCDGRSEIGLLAVSPWSRGRGIGRMLVRAANIWAASRGASVEQVVTQRANAAARHLYERCGYRVESRIPTRHLWRGK